MPILFKKYFLLLYFVILTYIFTSTEGCDGLSTKYGNMTQDHDIEVGNSTVIECTLFNSSILVDGTIYNVTSENLIMKFQSELLHDIEIHNSLSIQYVIQNASLSDSGSYTCFLVVPEPRHKTIVCSSSLTVGYKPLPIPAEDFQCLSLYYKNLTCSWKKPVNPVKTDYEIWDMLRPLKVKRKCAEVINDSSCRWTVNSYPPYRQASKNLSFLLEGRNSLGTNRQYFLIDHFKRVKPSQPKDLRANDITMNSILIHWLPPHGMGFEVFPPGLSYWLHYYAILYPLKSYMKINAQNDTSYLVKDLTPFTTYVFSLHCRPSIADTDDVWSEFVNITLRTEPDVPYLSPELLASTFDVQNFQKSRAISLYWKPIPSEYENGDEFQYVIHYHLHYSSTRFRRNSDQEIMVGNVSTYTFKHMELNSAYLFNVFARNKFGTSTNSSIIFVDKYANLLDPPKEISVLSHGHGNYTISWEPPPKAKNTVKNYTLFWCPNIRPRPFKCEGPIQWMYTNSSRQELGLFDQNTNYQFAVASNSLSSTSGMEWASCVVPYSGVLYKVKRVILTPKNSTSIGVRWMLDCAAQRDVIQEYQISYCVARKDSCSGTKQYANFKPSYKEEFIVGYLQPNTLYKFVVLARTADGWSEDSEEESESTMPAAPSGPPENVKITDVNDTTIYISFDAPSVPNGHISHYVIYYGKVMPFESMKHELEFSARKSMMPYVLEIENCSFFSNYSIEIKACVDLACSPLSPTVYALTGIGRPGKMETPHIEIFNSSLVNISWKPPDIPNGPIHMYVVLVAWQKKVPSTGLEVEIERDVFNVSGHENHLEINVTCPLSPSEDHSMYFISIEAINLKDGLPLFSIPSDPAQTRLCLSREGPHPPYALILGLAVGGALGMGGLVIMIYTLARWMKKEVDNIKAITVILPNGLDSPPDSTLSTYDTFKNGLQKNHDSGIPSEITYGRLCSFGDEHKLTQDSKNSNGILSEELVLKKYDQENSTRNHSGESNISNKGHDSIFLSSSNRTHLSFDSGAEVDLPPSPDGVFSETSSSNTTPRSYKPDLAIVKEINASSSRDSGLDKEVVGGASPEISGKNVDLSSRFAWYVKKRNLPYSNLHFRKSLPQMQPYSKFAVITPSLPAYIPVGGLTLGLLDCSLANSEPSVAEFEGVSDSEPLMFTGVPPYCRFGIARSAGNNLNLTSQILPDEQNFGYSKFGIIYRALKREGEPILNDFTYVPLGLTKLNEKIPPLSCKIGKSSELYDKTAFSSYFLDQVCPQFSVCHNSDNKQMKESLFDTYVTKNKSLFACPTLNSTDTIPRNRMEESVCLQTGDSPYSKFSIQPSVGKPMSYRGYISFSDTLNTASNTPLPLGKHQGLGYSKFILNCSKDNNEGTKNFIEDRHILETSNVNKDTCSANVCRNTIIDNSASNIVHPNHAESISSGNDLNSYIAFQDAKSMFSNDCVTFSNPCVQSSITTSLSELHDEPVLDRTEVKTGCNSNYFPKQHPSFQEIDDSSCSLYVGSKQLINSKDELKNIFPEFPEENVSCLPEISSISSSNSDVITPETYTKVQDHAYVPRKKSDVSASPDTESHENNPLISLADSELHNSNTFHKVTSDSENQVEKLGKNVESKKTNLKSNGYVTLSEFAGFDVSIPPQINTQVIVVPSSLTLPHFENV